MCFTKQPTADRRFSPEPSTPLGVCVLVRPRLSQRVFVPNGVLTWSFIFILSSRVTFCDFSLLLNSPGPAGVCLLGFPCLPLILMRYNKHSRRFVTQTPAEIRSDSWVSHDTRQGGQENPAGTTCWNGIRIFPFPEPAKRSTHIYSQYVYWASGTDTKIL